MNSERKWRKQKLLMRIQGWLWKFFSQRVVFSVFLFCPISLRMKTSFIVLFALLFSNPGFLQGQSSANDTSQTENVPPPTPYAVVDQDGNSRVWERTVYELDPSGNAVPKEHYYNELATGLNHLVNGQWLASSEDIDILPNGTAAATNGQHQAYFPGDIYEGQIELVTPDGLQLFSQPVALSYFDGTNSVLIAELTNSIGQVLGTNQVIYTNAFTGVAADLIYTYTKAGFEQDIVLREQPPTPESFGLNSQNTRLQVLTEFFDPPQPAIKSKMVSSDAGQLQNDTLDFGTMQMGWGKAFMLGMSSPSVSVNKQWLLLDGRQILVEEVPVAAIADELESLPLPTSQTSSLTTHIVSKHRMLPPQRLVKTMPKTMHMARASVPAAQGLVLDYVTMTSQSSYTFQGDTTYYISGAVDIYPGPAIFEGGAVFKYGGSTCTLQVGESCSFNWEASTYRPVVFTSMNDNSVGETISGSTGSPTEYAGPALEFEGDPGTLNHFRIAYAQVGLYLWDDGSDPGIAVSDAQFVNCQIGIHDYIWDDVTVENTLFANTTTNIDVYEASVAMENSTFANSKYLVISAGIGGIVSSLNLTNCILANVTNLYGYYAPSPFNGNFNGFYNSPLFGADTNFSSIYPFQTVGAGSYYLTNGCDFFNAGTTNIDPVLLADIANKTTYPPIVYSNITISVATNFSPQAQRDNTGNPDLGYHYDPVDYFFGGVNANSNLTFTVGTAVGWFELPGSGGPGYGIIPNNDVTVSFNGTVTSPCAFVRYDTVQEGGNGLWKDLGWLAGIAGGGSGATNNIPVLTALFTDFRHLSGDPNHFRDGSSGQPLVIQATDCEIFGNFGGYNMLGSYTNCLFDRVNFSQETASAYPYAIFRNCTFHGGSVDIVHDESSYYGDGPPFWYSSVRDSAFDSTTFSIGDPFGVNTNYADYNFNAFLLGAAQLSPEGTNNVVVTNSFNWQPSWFGNYYQSTNSLLIQKGDRTADQIGLYHFTTQTNQVPETNSIVDIGYHYVATDTNGIPLDSNGDGIPDYIEDANGNGLEIGWNITGDLGLQVIITQPRNGSTLP
jgi:hypothetical protein